MSSTLKSLVFWLTVVIAAFVIYQVSSTRSQPVASTRVDAAKGDVAGEWHIKNRPDQKTAIFRHGDVLLIVNERGDVASARLENAQRVIIRKGADWQDGSSADLRDAGQSLVWTDGSVWVRR
jgi:hypothetical protein